MTETSVNPYESQYGVGVLWDHMDWVLRIDVALLGVMLACTVVLIVRVSRCYCLALHRGIDSPAGKVVIAELKAHVGNLKSISSTATFLGLLGTCCGILSAFGGAATEKHAYLAWLISKMLAALVPCAAGIIVAVPATCAYTYGGTRLDLLVNELSSRNPLVTRPFTEVTSFGLIAAWLLAILLRVYVLPFTPFRTFKGLDVGIASVPCNTSERSIVLRISNEGEIFVNLEEQKDWRSVQNKLSEIYRMRAHRVLYLWAEEGVPYQSVADAIDTVKSIPENITVQLITPSAVNAGCPEPRFVGSSTTHSGL